MAPVGGDGLTALTSMLLLLAAGVGPTEPRTVRLSYEVDPGHAGCPDERVFRGWVGQRRGRDPFAEGAREGMRVVVRENDRSLVGWVLSEDQSGRRTGAREIPGDAGDCSELVATLALTLAVAIDPSSAHRPP